MAHNMIMHILFSLYTVYTLYVNSNLFDVLIVYSTLFKHVTYIVYIFKLYNDSLI
jgi:hypothetical protein